MNDRPLASVGSAVARANEAGRPQGVSLEMPVTLQGLSGPGGCQACYEEARTVLVMAQGAVLRLAAEVMPGQKVVLTNPRTQQEALAKVVHSRTHPNMKGYAEVEFTQPAPGFWGISFPSEIPSRVQQPAPVPATQPKPVLVTPTQAPVSALSVPAVRPAAPAAPKSGLRPVTDYGTHTAAPEVVPLADVVKKRGAAVTPVAAIAAPAPPVAPAVTVSKPAASFAPTKDVSASFGPKSTTEVVTLRIPQLGETARPVGPRVPRALVFVGIAAVILAGSVGLFLYTSSAASVDQTVSESATPPATVPPTDTSASAPAPDQAPAATTTAPANIPSTMPAPQSASQVTTEAPASAPRNAAVLPASASASAETVEVSAKRERKITPKVTLSAPIVNANKAAAAPVEPAPNVALEATPSSLTAPVLPMGLSNAATPPPPAPAPRLGGQVQVAKLISNPPPAYPPMARAQRLQGEVVLEVSIDAAGKVTKVNVVSGHPMLQEAATDAVLRWRYEPARLNGQAVATKAQVRVFFRP